MVMTKRIRSSLVRGIICVTALLLLTGLTACTAEPEETLISEEKCIIAVVPKGTGSTWFMRMEEGVEELEGQVDAELLYGGSVELDGKLQAEYVEKLIDRGDIDAICIVPFSTEQMEPVLKRAREAGILVISHEASGMENVDYDLEAFDNTAFGEHMMDVLAQTCGGRGFYVQMVGDLDAASHVQWVKAARDYQEKHYPEMKCLEPLIVSKDDEVVAYEQVKMLLEEHPDIAAIQGSATGDVAGAAIAVMEKGLNGQISLVGPSLNSLCGYMVENGTIQMISYWDPARAGQAMIHLALDILDGKEVSEGWNLGVDGYECLGYDPETHTFTGDAWIDVTQGSVPDSDF